MNAIKTEATRYVAAGVSLQLCHPFTSQLINNQNLKNVDQFNNHPLANICANMGNGGKIGDNYLHAIRMTVNNDEMKNKAFSTLSCILPNFNDLPTFQNGNEYYFYFFFGNAIQRENLFEEVGEYKIELVGTSKELGESTDFSRTIMPPSVMNEKVLSWENEKSLIDFLCDKKLIESMIVSHIQKENKGGASVIESTAALYDFDRASKNIERLDKEEFLNNGNNYQIVGKALFNEYANTAYETDAMILFENWFKNSKQWVRGMALERWKGFKKDNSTSLSDIFSNVKTTSKNNLDDFDEFLSNNKILTMEKLKKYLIESPITTTELSLIEKDIAKALTLGLGREVSVPFARKFMTDVKKDQIDEEEERVSLGLDITLANKFLDEKFTGIGSKGQKGRTILLQNDFLFVYRNGMWREIEQKWLESEVLNFIVKMMESKNYEYKAIKKIIYKKKRADDLNSLTHTIVSTVLKLITTPVYLDVLNLQRKRKYSYSVINTKNKEIYIENGVITVKDHFFDSYLINQFNVEYDANAKAPTYLNALKNCFSDKHDCEEIMRHYLETNGLSIQSRKDLELFLIYLGEGSNGKTFMNEKTTEIMGSDVCLRESLNDFGNDPHATYSLLGKLVFIDDDFKKNEILNDGLIKKTSSTRLITANPKNKNKISFYSNCTLTVIANGPPKSKDSSFGFTRRAQVFHFDKTFDDKQKDTSIGKSIDNEGSGILNLLIENYVNLSKRGHFLVPESCTKAKLNWAKASNPLHAFIDEYFEITRNSEDVVKGEDAYSMYKKFSLEENGSQPMSQQGFYADLSNLGGIKTFKTDRNYISGIKRKNHAKINGMRVESVIQPDDIEAVKMLKAKYAAQREVK